jgi:delta14-sterol reductase/lamin-B receptor
MPRVRSQSMSRSQSKSRSRSQPKKQKVSSVVPEQEIIKYEFGGPIGAFGVIFGLPLVVYMLYFMCNKELCFTTSNMFTFDWNKLVLFIQKSSNVLFAKEALYMLLFWFGLQLMLALFLPGEIALGVPIKELNNTRLKYPLSGHLQFWISIILMGHVLPIFIENSNEKGIYYLSKLDRLPLELIYDHYIGLITYSIIGSFLLSIYLYTSSFTFDNNGEKKILAKGGNTGSIIYDFFIGRELNPRLFGNTLDLKYICELRPGLIGWVVINLGMAVKQYYNNGTPNSHSSIHGISLSMLLVILLQGIYVWDALYQERAILTTMDITTDGFGYMLAFGDLSWVPFIYSLQARYLVDYDPGLSLPIIVIIIMIHTAGYFIFRCANSEKDRFRRDPNSDLVKHLSFIETKRGTKLITSGWWGMARKINYTGDWLITFSWCLLCGFDSPIPYFQAIYFAILLVHRAIRDDEMCHEKYGDDWLEYKKKVPYMFIPFVF